VLILLDNNAPRGLARALIGHTVTEARERGWATLKNGDLLTAADEAGFEVLVTSDKSIRYQQNLRRRKIAIVALGKGRWTLIKPHVAQIVAAVNAATPASFTEIEIPE
jgi:hypothetical protein